MSDQPPPRRSVSDQPPPRIGPKELPSGERPPMFRHPGRVAIVAAALFGIVVLVAIAIGSADTSDLQADQDQPKEVQNVTPPAGSIQPPNTSIVVDLRDDLTGDLTVCAPTPNDCTPVPQDQTTVVDSLGQITFKPGDGKDITEFPTGPVSVRIDYHLQGSPAADAGNFTWSFTVKA